MRHRISVEPFPPGEYIQQALDARGWTQDDLAEVMGRHRHTILRLLNGQTAITPETAHELAKAFDTSPELWMNLQTSYELALAAKEDREIERRAKIYKKVPVRDVKKRGWIADAADTEQLERSVCDLLKIENIDAQPRFAVAARKSTDYETPDTPEQIAWFAYAWKLAEAAPASKYDELNFDAGLAELHKLSAYPEDARRIPRALADMGIRLVLIEHLPRSKVDGVAFWLDESSPAIALSLRFDRIDNLWFTLIHEMMHIKHRHQSPIDVDLGPDSQKADLPEIERQANADACNALIPTEKLDHFILRNRRLYYQTKIVQFAQARGVHPGIVVGLLHGRGELDWKYHRKLLVKVRSEIVGHALTDGWGNSPKLK